ncbi:MAG: class I SAM-dependent methyltransferase [Flavobacteriales bacterium]|nr:class I SAM-dependent methyltransferase [Flavobacteriales bacterium]
MRSTERFTGLATIYGQARPTYPPELVRWCLEQAPAPGLIVDLGCGTGISTRLFATTGHPVIGIDPNADMLATARRPWGRRTIAWAPASIPAYPMRAPIRRRRAGLPLVRPGPHLRRSGAHRHRALRLRGLLERAPGGHALHLAMRPCCARGQRSTR